MPEQPPIRSVIGLPPDETFRAFDARRDARLTTNWDELWQEEHARFFTVAKVAKLDLLHDVQSSLADMIANGGTFEQWQANLVPTLQRQGWWGTVQDRALTGTDEAVTIGPRRLRTIYDTNLRVSRAAGRWARIQELKGERPFLRYTAVLDSRTRPEHRAWHGVILPVDHDWWNTHFPPCGWYCRCTVRQLSQADLDRKGWSVTADPPGGEPKPFFRSATGETVTVPPGIAPGFAYNPGRASLSAIAERAALSLEAIAATDLAAARATVAELVASDVLPVFIAQKATLPVAVLDRAQAELVGAPSPVVVLPAGVQRKQERRHGELGVEDYRLLPDAIHDPTVVIEAAPGEKALFYIDRAGRLWKAVVRTDQGRAGRYPAVVSFHMTDAADLRREARKGRIVLDRRFL